MSHLLMGFGDELTKTAGPAKALGKLIMKKPFHALGAGLIGGGTLMAAGGAYKKGLKGGDRGRYLAATFDSRSGRARPSRAAYTNYHQLFKHEPTAETRRRLHEHYNERAFKR